MNNSQYQNIEVEMTLPSISNHPQVDNSHTTVVNMEGDIPQALNGVEALSKMPYLTIRNAKFQNGAKYEIIAPTPTGSSNEAEDAGCEYFVMENKNQNTILVYAKFQDTESLKIVKESRKNFKVYDHDDQCFGHGCRSEFRFCVYI